MNRYKLFNNILGWLVGIAACAVYVMTAEATASWWDCGEYIATSVNLEVGHPPGAPTFQLFGRLFSMFSSPENQAFAVNCMSAIVSGLGIMFLFWTITMLAKLIIREPNPDIKDPRTWGIFAAGIVGAMCYCFSDTYWFSAVEGEVYATSSFFTAVVFWAILKWEEQSDDPHSLRWLILVCFLVGLAIGVHLLNLLTIPAIVYVVYFKKWPKTTTKGFILSGLISLVILAVVLWGIIPWVVNISSAFDVFCVNSLHLGFNTGTIIFFLLLAAAIVWGLWWTSARKKNKPVLNASILGFLMLLVGYSTFFILVIRANTNTPLNENAPKDAVALRAYLGREQYGDTPLLTGQYYTAGRPIGTEEGYAKYVRGKDANGKDTYILKDHAQKAIYNEKHCGVFPRMYSNDEGRGHIRFYEYWADKAPIGEKPTMSQNIRYFNGYQMGWMYWRYFMWNFAGRQNDIQGHYFNDDGSRDYLNGNWICGIKFIDQMRLGPQDNLSDEMKNNKGRNVYYLLPLLLGLIGLVYHCKEDKRGAFVNFIMFFMTGIAIAIYLNMPPRQPRERDYAFVGSFYFFAVWVGLGVLAIADWLSRLSKSKTVQSLIVAATFALCFVAVPVKMCAENWDDHDRSEKTAARDFAKNYLGNLSQNSILISYGDNDTFPLWYVQEVEHWRTDVRMLNYTLSGMHWYIEQLYNKLYESDPLPLTLPYEEFYGLGNDIYYLDNRRADGEPVEFAQLLRLMKQNPSQFTQMVQGGQTVKFIPATKFKITLDLDKLVSLGKVSRDYADTLIAHGNNVIYFEPQQGYLLRSDMMLLDFIATNGFERDIYVMSPSYITKIFPPAANYCQPDGLVYKLCFYPVKAERFSRQTADYFINGFVNADGSRTPLQWGNLNADIYVDPISLNSGVVQRQNFAFVAEDCLNRGDKETARKLIELSNEFFPAKNFARDRYMIAHIGIYQRALGTEKAIELWNDIFNYYSQDLAYISQYAKSSNRNLKMGVSRRLMEDVQALYGLGQLADTQLNSPELSEKAHQLAEPFEYILMQPSLAQ